MSDDGGNDIESLLNRSAQAIYDTASLLSVKEGLTLLNTVDIDTLRRILAISENDGNEELSKLLTSFLLSKE